MSVYNTYKDRHTSKNHQQQQQQHYQQQQPQQQQQQQFSSRNVSQEKQNNFPSTDKDQYIKYLEEQTDRLQGIIYDQSQRDAQMSTISFQMQEQEEKFENVTRLIKLLQQFAESQEDENKSMKQTMKLLFQEKQYGSEFMQQNPFTPEVMSQVVKKVDINDGNIQKIIHQMNEFQNNCKQSIQQFEQQSNSKISQLSTDFAEALREIQSRITEVQQNTNQKMNQEIQDNFDILRHELNQKVDIVMQEVRLGAYQVDLDELSRKVYKSNKNFQEFREKIEGKYPRAFGKLNSPTNILKSSKSVLFSNSNKKKRPKSSGNKTSHSRSRSPNFEDFQNRICSPNNQVQKSILKDKSKSPLKNDVVEIKIQIDKIIGKQKIQQKKIDSLLPIAEFEDYKQKQSKRQTQKIYAKVLEKVENLITTNNNNNEKKPLKSATKKRKTSQSISQEKRKSIQKQTHQEEGFYEESFGISQKTNQKPKKQSLTEQDYAQQSDVRRSYSTAPPQHTGSHHQSEFSKQFEKNSALFQNEGYLEPKYYTQGGLLSEPLIEETHHHKKKQSQEFSAQEHLKQIVGKKKNGNKLVNKKSVSPPIREGKYFVANSSNLKTIQNKKQTPPQIFKHNDFENYLNTSNQLLQNLNYSTKKGKRKSNNVSKMISNSIERSRSKSHLSCETCRNLSQQSQRARSTSNGILRDTVSSRSRSAKGKRDPLQIKSHTLSVNDFMQQKPKSKSITPKRSKISNKENIDTSNKENIKQKNKQDIQQQHCKNSSVNKLVVDRKEKEQKIKSLVKKRREKNQISPPPTDQLQTMKNFQVKRKNSKLTSGK